MGGINKHIIQVSFFSALSLSALLVGCDGGQVQSEDPAASSVEEARKKHPDMAHGGGSPDMTTGGSTDLATAGWPAPNPPPASCDQRNAGVTSLQVVVRVDQYQGLIHGRNGDHEIAYGTVLHTSWVYDQKIVDTQNVQLAMNVASSKDPAGLPHEIPLSVGQTLEVEGEYIPASTANAHDQNGAAAVIHYTHSTCGYVNLGGTVYR